VGFTTLWKRIPVLWGRLRGTAFVAAVTPLGWATLLVGGATTMIGWSYGWLEFRGLGFLALTLLVLAVLLTLRRPNHDVTLELHQPRVPVGEPGLGRVLVHGRPGGTPAATVELPVGRAVARFRVASLGENDEHEELFSIPTRHRGVIPVGPVRTVQADPVGLIRRTRVFSEPMELFVHPRMVPVEVAAIGFLKDVEGITTANLSSSDVSFHALRDYVPGDDRRSVHWRATAHTGRLMVRQFEETMRAHLLLVLSNLRSDYATEDDFETAVSVAASLAVAALREERQVTLYTFEGLVAFPNTMGLLDELCRVKLIDEGPALSQVVLRAGHDTPGASVTAFITGDTDPTGLRAAQLTLPPQIRTFALRVRAGMEMARRQLGDLTVMDVPRLDQLSMVMRSIT
jgi:hypothetical protein